MAEQQKPVVARILQKMRVYGGKQEFTGSD